MIFVEKCFRGGYSKLTCTKYLKPTAFTFWAVAQQSAFAFPPLINERTGLIQKVPQVKINLSI